jgi:hypothetical protein
MLNMFKLNVFNTSENIMNDFTAPTLLAYLAVAIPLTLWVARQLQRHGRVFLVDVFHGNDAVADAVNSLLIVGFLLFNLGYVLMFVKNSDRITTATGVVNLCATKIGTVSLFLGAFHLVNMLVFTKVRRSAMNPTPTPRPLYPTNAVPGYLYPPASPNMATVMSPNTATANHAPTAPPVAPTVFRG